MDILNKSLWDREMHAVGKKKIIELAYLNRFHVYYSHTLWGHYMCNLMRIFLLELQKAYKSDSHAQVLDKENATQAH